MPSASAPSSGPPRSWSPARRLARLFIAPVERFLAVEAAGGMVLLAAATLALLWANSPWSASYASLWATPLGGHLGAWEFSRELRWWVNDGLMTLFFLVVGLEIRRELDHGELSELRRAALPVAAALGGMIVPAAVYASLNHGTGGAAGWGVPMATDIAFAVGVLALLGNRVPPALRILLLALAVIDDLGAILVIALFYSDGIHAAALAVAALGVGGIVGLQLVGARSSWSYVPFAVVVWAATYASGVHPTLAGVVLGLLTPVEAWLGPVAFAAAAETAAGEVRSAARSGATDIHDHLATVARAAREAVSPVERMEHRLHGWVAWGIMPLFAFANAGVSLGRLELSGDGWRVFLGVLLGLVLGKPIGVLLATRGAVAMGAARLPRGVRWADVSIVGGVAGIGFTMALFIAQLAFEAGPLLETAKFAILAASAAAGVAGFLLGRRVLPAGVREAAATSLTEAERSTEA